MKYLSGIAILLITALFLAACEPTPTGRPPAGGQIDKPVDKMPKVPEQRPEPAVIEEPIIEPPPEPVAQQ